MSIFIMGETERAAVRAAFERARAKPIPWEVLRHTIAANQGTDTLKIGDRRGTPRREPEQVALPLGYRLAVTFEEQPSGLCAHLSMSAAGKLPDPVAVALVIKAVGLEHAARRAWIEEFLIGDQPGGRAINVVLVVEPQEPQ